VLKFVVDFGVQYRYLPVLSLKVKSYFSITSVMLGPTKTHNNGVGWGTGLYFNCYLKMPTGLTCGMATAVTDSGRRRGEPATSQPGPGPHITTALSRLPVAKN
jgi:hypothetical protein